MSSAESASQVEENTGAYLKTVAQDLQERVKKLRDFEEKAEINKYCDDLKSQVIDTAKAMVATVNKLQEEMLAEVESYRSNLLEEATISKTLKRQSADDLLLKHDLEKLAKEVELFSTKCSIRFDKEIIESGTISATEREAEEFKQRAKDLRRRQRHRLFKSEFMKLNEGIFRLNESEYFTRLDLFERDVEDDSKIQHLVLRAADTRANIIMGHDVGLDEKIDGALFGPTLFLTDDQLAIGIHLNSVFVVSIQSKKRMYELEPVQGQRHIVSFTRLNNGNLVACAVDLREGMRSSQIIVWNLESRKHVRIIQVPDQVAWIKIGLRDTLVCESRDLIRVIDLDQNTSSKLKAFKIPLERPNRLEVLSNNQLAIRNSCGLFTIWDLTTREHVKTGFVFKNYSGEFRLLANGEAIMFFPDGKILMRNLLTDQPSRTIFHDYGPALTAFIQPDNSILFVHLGKEDFANIAGPFYDTDLVSRLLSCSPGGKWMALLNGDMLTVSLRD